MAFQASIATLTPLADCVMKAHVLGVADYSQIVGRIIRWVFVDVMDVLSYRRISHNAMLVSPFTVRAFDPDVAIAPGLERADRFTTRVAVFFEPLCEPFAPVLSAVAWNKFWITINTTCNRTQMGRDVPTTSTGTKFGNRSRSPTHGPGFV
jgi:hypothetical protein